MSKSRLGLVLAAMTFAALLAPAAATAAFTSQTITSDGPLDRITIGGDLSCQNSYADVFADQFAPNGAAPGDCGTFVVVDDELYAPSFADHSSTNVSGLGDHTPFTPRDQSGVRGTGTTADPFVIVTTVDAGDVRITQTDSYVTGDASYKTDVRAENTAGVTRAVRIYRAGDCTANGSPQGFAFTAPGEVVGCAQNPSSSPPGLTVAFHPESTGATFLDGAVADVWAAIGAHGQFPNTCACNSFIDHAAGLSWRVPLGPGAEETRSSRIEMTGQLKTLVSRNSAGRLRVLSAHEADSDFTVSDGGPSWVVRDPNSELQASGPCTLVDSHQANCPKSGTTSLEVVARDGSDQVTNNTPLASLLDGGPGQDVLRGGSGEDLLKGGRGGDTLFGGSGGRDLASYEDKNEGVTADIDVQPDDGDASDGPAGARDNVRGDVEGFVGSRNDDTFTGNAADNRMFGNRGADTFFGGGGSDTVTYVSPELASTATTFFDVLASLDAVANDGNSLDENEAGARDNIRGDVENIEGGSGSDRLVGDSRANRLSGSDSNDVLEGRGGPDSLGGGQGADTATYVGRAGAVTADPDGAPDDGNGDDGPAGARDTIETDVENLTGGNASDSLTGNNADNVLNGGPGSETFFGGGGTDTVSYAGRATVTVDIDAVADDGNSGDGPAGARDNVRGDVENLTGGNDGDTLTGDGDSNVIDGGPGPDVMNGLGGVDTANYASRTVGGVTVDIDSAPDDGDFSDGPAGARDNVRTDMENLIGSGGEDTLTGDGDPNLIEGGLGGDVMFGGGGVDTVTYKGRARSISASIDAVANDGEHLDDFGGDNIRGDVENLIGGNGDDTLRGGSSANELVGGPGGDTMFGGGGADTVSYAERTSGVRVTIDAVGNDGDASDGSFGGTTPRDNVRGDVENLTGGGGDDSLTGNGLGNVLIGGRGLDRLFGLGGSDIFDVRDGETDLQVSCGTEFDSVTGDAGDPADADCELVSQP